MLCWLSLSHSLSHTHTRTQTHTQTHTDTHMGTGNAQQIKKQQTTNTRTIGDKNTAGLYLPE